MHDSNSLEVGEAYFMICSIPASTTLLIISILLHLLDFFVTCSTNYSKPALFVDLLHMVLIKHGHERIPTYISRILVGVERCSQSVSYAISCV
jgi:hypothetical protein